VSFTARIVSPLDDGTHIYNEAEVESAEVAAFMTNETDTLVETPVVAVTKNDFRDEIAVGANNTYHIIIRNNGLTPITNVVITDTLPADVTFISADKTPSYVDDYIVQWTLSSLQPGDFYLILVKIHVDIEAAEQTLHNIVTLTSQQTGEIMASDDTLVSAVPGTIKMFNPEPYFDDSGNEYVTPETTIYLNYTAPDLLDTTRFRIWKWIPDADGWVLLFNWTTTDEGQSSGLYPIHLCAIGDMFQQGCCGLYQIEFYSIDTQGWFEPLQWNDVYVDCAPPITTKEYSGVQTILWEGPVPIHQLGQNARIYLNASDGPGSGVAEIWYKIYTPTGTLYNIPNRPHNYTLYQGSIVMQGSPGNYVIYYQAIDNIGNLERERKQIFHLADIP